MNNDVVPENASILLTLREAVKVERDGLIRHQMKMTADKIQVVIKALSEKPTPALMRDLNGAWVRAIHYLSIAKGGPDDGPNSAGLEEGARLTA